MDIKTVKEVTQWMNTTDLSEICWRKNGDGFELKAAGTPHVTVMPSCRVEPVPSPAVGIYRLAAPGKSADVKGGMCVKKGQHLGHVEMVNEKKPVMSPCDGNIEIVCVEDGNPVQFGQPLFFVERS